MFTVYYQWLQIAQVNPFSIKHLAHGHNEKKDDQQCLSDTPPQ